MNSVAMLLDLVLLDLISYLYPLLDPTPQQPRLPGVIVQCAMLIKTEVLGKNALDCTAVPS